MKLFFEVGRNWVTYTVIVLLVVHLTTLLNGSSINNELFVKSFEIELELLCEKKKESVISQYMCICIYM